jgi:hypothetical protein
MPILARHSSEIMLLTRLNSQTSRWIAPALLATILTRRRLIEHSAIKLLDLKGVAHFRFAFLPSARALAVAIASPSGTPRLTIAVAMLAPFFAADFDSLRLCFFANDGPVQGISIPSNLNHRSTPRHASLNSS